MRAVSKPGKSGISATGRISSIRPMHAPGPGAKIRTLVFYPKIVANGPFAHGAKYFRSQALIRQANFAPREIMRGGGVTRHAMISYHSTPEQEVIFTALEIGGDWYDL